MQKKKRDMKKKDVEKRQSIFSRVRIRLSQLPWKKALSWLAELPWGLLWRHIRGFLRKRVMPLFCVLLCLCLLFGSMALIVSAAVCDKTEERIVTAEQLGEMETAFDYVLVLGCRVYGNGDVSAMLYDRVKTACELYHLGVCDRLLMSGDNQSKYYNEVDPMKQVAIKQGVPEEAIVTDPYGLSTYDSVVRLLEQFQGKRVVIVTQRYHLHRALYIAQKLGIDAYGVSADLRPYFGQFKREVREIFARCKDVVYAQKRPEAAGEPAVS